MPEREGRGGPKTTTIDYDSTARLKHLHGGAGSLKPQIYDATAELDEKIRVRVFRRSRNVQESTGPQEIRKEIPQENSEKHLHNMYKVVTYSRSNFQDAEFDRAG